MTTLSQFHAAVVASVALRFGDNINTVLWYEQGETASGQPLPIITPAVILEIESAEEGDDIGDDRAPLLMHITAYCILGQQTDNLQMEVRNFASQLFALIRKNKWTLGHSVSFPGGITLGPGKFDPEKNGYESWFVSWDQTIYLGDNVWDSTGIPPQEVWLGLSPEIGLAFVDKYTRIVP
jgi:hypothetical protein